MNYFVVGAAPGASSADLAASLAAVLGILARHRCLVIDLDPQATLSRHHLAVVDTGGVEPLVEHFLRNGQLSLQTLRENLSHHNAVGFDRRGFEVLPGAMTFSAPFADRISGLRGQAFVKNLRQVCEALNLDDVIINLDRSIDTLMGEAAMTQAQQVIIVHSGDEEACSQWALSRLRILVRDPHLAGRTRVTQGGILPYPSPQFVLSFNRKDKSQPLSSAEIALDLAANVYSEIYSQLTDNTGQAIRVSGPSWLSRLIGFLASPS